MAVASCALAIGNAKADLGDTRQSAAQRYTKVPHGAEGHSSQENYRDNYGYTILQWYNKHGIACAVFYGQFTPQGDLKVIPQEAVDRFLHLNHLPLLDSDFWIEDRPDNGPGSNWRSKDGRYTVGVGPYGLTIQDWLRTNQ